MPAFHMLRPQTTAADHGHYLANPEQLVASAAQVHALTRSRTWAASHSSPAPEARRAGSEDFRRHPSRIGDRRVYRDGRVEIVE